MPLFLGIDYFGRKVLNRQQKLRRLLLQKKPIDDSTSFKCLKNDIYRLPWNAFNVDHQKSAKEDSEDMDIPTSYISDVSKINQEEPPFKLDVKDVTQGLLVENIADSPCLADLPVIVSACFTNAKSSQADIGGRATDEMRFIPANEEEISHTVYIGKEVPLSFKIQKGVDSCERFSRNILLPEPMFANDIDSPEEFCPGGRIEEMMDLGKMAPKVRKEGKYIIPENVSVKKSMTLHKNVNQLIEHPVTHHEKANDNSKNLDVMLLDIDYDIVQVEEEVLHLSKWDLNVVMERHPESFHTLNLPQPKINSDNLDNADWRFSFALPSELAESNTDALQSLIWNPFLIDSVAMNIEKTAKSLTAQHSCVKKGDPSSVQNCNNYKWTTEEFKPDSEIEFSTVVKEPRKRMASNTDCSATNAAYPHLGFLPKMSGLRKSLDLNESVTNFMTLRKKVASNGDDCESIPRDVVVSEKGENVITEEINCEIDELTSKFVRRILELSKCDINVLVLKGVLKDFQALYKVDKASLEFSLKEHIKSDDKVVCESLLKLIPIKKAFDMALQIDTETCLDYLKSLQHKDDRFLLCIQDLSQIQMESMFTGMKTSKMMKLCTILSKSPGMTLILISDARQSKSFLLDSIIKTSGVPVAPTISFPDYNCYLYNTEDITDEFPWQKFGTVIEYNNSSTFVKNCISKYRLKHYILSTSLPVQDNFPTQDLEEFKIIAYSSLDFKVLQCLESDYHFVVFQRKTSGQYTHETLIIDEKTCIVIVKNLSEINQARLLSTLFITISLKYSSINLIFDVSSCHRTELFSVIFASIAHFQPASLQIRSFYCLSVDEICRRIVKVAQHAKDNVSAHWKSTDLWLKRTWLTEDESNHEMILSKIPCINSYVAQIMLTTYSLQDLMGLDLQECIENMPVIPENTLTEFYRTVHQTRTSEHNRTVQFDTQPSVQEYTPTQVVESPHASFQRTSLPPLNTSYDMEDALATTYQTPQYCQRDKYAHLIKTPMKPHNVVRPFSSRDNISGPSQMKRAVEEKHKYSFSFSKHRKVMIDRDNVKNDGQATLFIGR